MAFVRDDAQVDFEEAMQWLPSQVLDEAFDSKKHMRNRHQKQQQQGYHRFPREPHSQQCSKYAQRPKHGTGGRGMQAVFLVSGQRSSGTGVFLPQKAGTKSTRKPGPKYGPRSGEVYTSSESTKKKDQKNAVKQCSVISQSQSFSPEIFLPKEWTY